MSMYQKVTNSILFIKEMMHIMRNVILKNFFNQKWFFNNAIEAKQKIINMIWEDLFKIRLNKIKNIAFIKEDLFVEENVDEE